MKEIKITNIEQFRDIKDKNTILHNYFLHRDDNGIPIHIHVDIMYQGYISVVDQIERSFRILLSDFESMNKKISNWFEIQEYIKEIENKRYNKEETN